jgi:hypothetical protein
MCGYLCVSSGALLCCALLLCSCLSRALRATHPAAAAAAAGALLHLHTVCVCMWMGVGAVNLSIYLSSPRILHTRDDGMPEGYAPTNSFDGMVPLIPTPNTVFQMCVPILSCKQQMV